MPQHSYIIHSLECRRLLSGTDGTLDPTFGVNGGATLDVILSAEDSVSKILTLPTGGFLAAHDTTAITTNDATAFSWHKPDGTLDTSFGGGTGTKTISGWTYIPEMFRRSSGEIIAVGSGSEETVPAVRAFSASGAELPASSFSFPVSAASGNRVDLLPFGTAGGGYVLTNLGVTKFNPNGSLDSSFGSGGTFTFPTVNNVRFRATGLSADSAGSLLISGYTELATGGGRVAGVAKVTTAGAFAAGWGTNGIVPVNGIGAGVSQLTSIAVDASNRALVTATDTAAGVVARLTAASGALDTSFDTDGFRAFPAPAGQKAYAEDVVLDSAGRIVVAGLYQDDATPAITHYLARVTPAAGALDNTFAGDGIQEALLPASAGAQIWYGPPTVDAADNLLMGLGVRSVFNRPDSDSVLFRISGANGQRDTTFGPAGGNGTTVVSFSGPSSNSANGYVRQPDGKLLFAGTASANVSYWLVGRLNADGSPDTSFGSGGTTKIDWGLAQLVSSITLDHAGRIVLAGLVGDTSVSEDMGVARLTPTGQPDATFGTAGTGRVRLSLPGATETPLAVGVQSDNRIILGGHVNQGVSTPRRAAVVRLNENGSLDTTFGTGGTTLITPATASNGIVATVIIRDDDRILVSGDEDGPSSAPGTRRFGARLTRDGVLDPTYGAGGIAYANTAAQDLSSGSAHAVVDADGRLYIPSSDGAIGGQALVTRLTASGQIDATYGTAGTSTTTLDPSGSVLTFTALGVDRFGRVFVGGRFSISNTAANSSDMAIFRLLPDGRPDRAFGNAGRAQIDVAGGGDSPIGFAFTPDDKLIAFSRSSTTTTGTDFAAARLINLPPSLSAPRVTKVLTAGTWDIPFTQHLFSISGETSYAIDPADQLNELPWTTLKQFSIRFDRDVTVTKDNLTVNGVAVPSYAISSFSYDTTTFTARWILNTTGIGADKLALNLTGVTDFANGLALDGEWPGTTGGAFPSGDGNPGGDFHFRVNVLPGDVNRSGGAVLGSDVTLVRNAQNSTPGAAGSLYTIFKDVNGSGSILGSDVTLVRNRQGLQLPSGEPTTPSTVMQTNAGLGGTIKKRNTLLSDILVAVSKRK